MPVVYVVSNGRINLRRVKLGLQSEVQNRVEVTEGVGTGELVVAARLETLTEGMQVKVVEPPADPAVSLSR